MIWQHVKTGGLYETLSFGEMESDLSMMVIYRSVADGRIWIRPEAEFYDGRFVEVANENEEYSISEVFDEVRAERQHQDDKWGPLGDKNQSLVGFLLILRKELEEAEMGWMKNKSGRDSALGEIVQIAAVAVAALQQYGFEGN